MVFALCKFLLERGAMPKKRVRAAASKNAQPGAVSPVPFKYRIPQAMRMGSNTYHE